MSSIEVEICMGMDLSSDYGVRGDAGVLRGGVVIGLRVGMGSSIILQHGGGVIGFEVGEGVVCCAVSDSGCDATHAVLHKRFVRYE